ncbi:Domain of unknown function (DUF4139) [Leishmania donovani]|uniref:Domain_of_uncharacterized_function_(DUF4139)_-_pu tative n=4 Tax=Leishmania donovani species complex TaxID=38574 RepID=A0A6L0XL00_LEIIN|nr:conserved hypothetical protein [Leishmania infantum JPCM5]AYU80896.1 protein of unknown function (DUF4139), putative [Leishmania donovani]CAC9512697.1 Domain_of_uncharacterised_function_(DUF4139)_-_putative [Leishmania infantum]CAJ1990882.1 Domain of unknown function (DUF4139) [Leishmania donovani]CAM69993.1 conserved hypothetical protein [Leishmania infantum JPCM5]SUZ43913.1 Domain_of_uncharacterised_function_(DUF4139)_-_putative [Leishmania infantum]|eukprot:XP_001466943.1 conserved hypothetical protein [Leishmania infantum JPCM5]
MSRVTLAPKLEAVTVYGDRAQLTFSAPVVLKPSARVVAVVENIEQWGDVDWATLQVRIGEATDPAVAAAVLLQNISPVRETVRQDVRADVQRQKDVIKRIEEEQCACEEGIAALEESCQHLERIKCFVSSAGRGDCAVPPESAGHLQAYMQDPVKWGAMASFFATRRATAQRGLAELRTKLADVEERLEEAQQRLSDLGGDSGVRLHTKSALEATLVVGAGVVSGTKLMVELSCVVSGAGWSPLYDLRVNYAESKLEVLYSANVHQCTSLDWEKVRLRLSTATPHAGASPPPLWPRWTIWTRPPAPAMGALRGGPLARRRMGANSIFFTAPNTKENFAAPVTPMVEAACVEGCGSSSNATVYAIPGLATVRHNNADVKVTVAREKFPARLRFVCVPKVDPLVHLSATAVNATDYEFIAGPSKVFYGNTFVNQSQLGHVSPGEEFEVSLGTDETVKVSRTLVRRAESEKTSVFSSTKSQLRYHYAYTVECFALPSDAPVTVVVKDNYPVSDDADVDVVLEQPTATAAGENLCSVKGEKVTVDEDTHEVAWTFSMAKHEKKNFDMVFVARYPVKTPVFGLQ